MKDSPAQSAESIPLSQLPLEHPAVIRFVRGDPGFRQRLLELGLVPGVEVRTTRTAPLGDPLEIEIRGASFSIRRAEAEQVQVSPLSLEPPEGPLAKRRTSSSPERAEPRERYRVAVLGNPNVGKTSLFNALTGHSGRVGNYPGITVERLVGQLELDEGMKVELVDVPGTYTLNARSDDERVAIAELLGFAAKGRSAQQQAPPADRGEGPDAAIVVLRYATLQRGLYFLMQVQELGLPVLAVVNMLDEARAKGCQVQLESLKERFQMPFVGTVANTGEGMEQLKTRLAELLAGDRPESAHTWHWEPSAHLAEHLDEIAETLGPALAGDTLWRRRAFALWCLMSLPDQDDEEPSSLLELPSSLRERTLAVRQAMHAEGHDLDLEVTQARYRHIDADIERYGWKDTSPNRRDLTQTIDGVLTHPLWGGLVFLITMALIFAALFDWAQPLVDGVNWLFATAAKGAQAALPPGILTDLLKNGVLAGVGSVLSFLPQILLLFFFIALLEGTGYMARVAFMTDRLMQRLGLHGGALVPLVSGFACAVPAVMATRTIERRRDRLLTIMALPLISCSARLPVYTLIIAALFPSTKRVLGPLSLGMLMMLGVYLFSTLLALAAVAVLGRTVLKGRPAPLLLELPPYRWPSLRTVASVLAHRCKVFVKTAGTVILAATIVLWVLLSFPGHPASADYRERIAAATRAKQTKEALRLSRELRAKQLAHSYAGRLGKAIEPAIAPLGFDWQIGVGLIGAFAAREVFVSTMGLIYGVGEADEKSNLLRAAIKAQRRSDGQPLYTPLVGLSLIVFFMIAMQCLSTMAVVRQESGAWRWALFQLAYLSALAYLAALAVYQLGRALGYS